MGLLVCFGSVGFEGSAANPKLVNMEGGSYGTRIADSNAEDPSKPLQRV